MQQGAGAVTDSSANLRIASGLMPEACHVPATTPPPAERLKCQIEPGEAPEPSSCGCLCCACCGHCRPHRCHNQPPLLPLLPLPRPPLLLPRQLLLALPVLLNASSCPNLHSHLPAHQLHSGIHPLLLPLLLLLLLQAC